MLPVAVTSNNLQASRSVRCHAYDMGFKISRSVLALQCVCKGRHKPPTNPNPDRDVEEVYAVMSL